MAINVTSNTYYMPLDFPNGSVNYRAIIKLLWSGFGRIHARVRHSLAKKIVSFADPASARL
jgi:hypothetical protein